MRRFYASSIQGILTVATAALAIWLALYAPTDDVTRAHFVDGLIALAGLSVLAVVVLSWVERRRDEEWDQKLKTILEHLSTSDTVTKARDRPVIEQDPVPHTLREAGMVLAKNIREFIAGYDGTDDDLLVRFWDIFPFREYDALKQRFEVPLGRFNVRSAAEWLPNTRENIRHIADNIEGEALRVPRDVLR